MPLVTSQFLAMSGLQVTEACNPRSSDRRPHGRGACAMVGAMDENPEQCFVYVLGCERGARYQTYVGWTTDLARRLKRHNSGTGAKSTRGGSWVLVYVERCATRREAMSREWRIKRDRKLRQQIRASFGS